MKLHLVIALFFAIFLSSCTDRASRPKPLLSERKMVELLVEVHILEAALQHLQMHHHDFEAIRDYTNAAYSELFERFGLNQESFEANLRHRTHRSRDLERIYSRVYEILRGLDEQHRAEIQSFE